MLSRRITTIIVLSAGAVVTSIGVTVLLGTLQYATGSPWPGLGLAITVAAIGCYRADAAQIVAYKPKEGGK